MIFTFSGTIASFIDDEWRLTERVVDFYCLDEKEHSGDHGAKAFVKSAAARGGLNKMSYMFITNIGEKLTNCLLLSNYYGQCICV